MVRCLIKPLFTLVSLLVLSGCQSTPQPLLLSPVKVTTPLAASVSSVKVDDERSHAYLYRIQGDDEKVQFGPLQNPLKDTLQQSLAPAVINSTADGSQWFVTIDEAIVKVTPGLVKYQLEHQLVLRVEAQHHNRHYSNTYRGVRTSEGAMRPDEAVIEREFSLLLETVLNDIASDPKLRLKQQEAQ